MIAAWESKVFGAVSTAFVGEPIAPDRASFVLGDLRTRAPKHVAFGLRALLWLTALLAPLLLLGRPRRFLRLSSADRESVCAAALDHRSVTVRQLAVVLKMAACLCRFDEDVS